MDKETKNFDGTTCDCFRKAAERRAAETERSVWVALWASQMDSEFVGVFSTEEMAQEAATMYQEEQGYGDGYVEQWEIDGTKING